MEVDSSSVVAGNTHVRKYMVHLWELEYDKIHTIFALCNAIFEFSIFVYCCREHVLFYVWLCSQVLLLGSVVGSIGMAKHASCGCPLSLPRLQPNFGIPYCASWLSIALYTSGLTLAPSMARVPVSIALLVYVGALSFSHWKNSKKLVFCGQMMEVRQILRLIQEHFSTMEGWVAILDHLFAVSLVVLCGFTLLEREGGCASILLLDSIWHFTIGIFASVLVLAAYLRMYPSSRQSTLWLWREEP